MAFLAFHHGVRPEQRKAVEVLLNRLRGDLPAENSVALRAVGPKLAAMNVGVAIRAILADVGENRFRMAARAGHLLVHASQRIPRGVMVEFRNGANGSPAGIRVAVFTGNIEGTVRTPAWLPLGISPLAAEAGKNQEREVTTDLGYTRNNRPLTQYELRP